VSRLLHPAARNARDGFHKAVQKATDDEAGKLPE
jgi:hypothetical protein